MLISHKKEWALFKSRAVAEKGERAFVSMFFMI